MSVKQISLKSFHALGRATKKRDANKARAIRRMERQRAAEFEIRNWRRSQRGEAI